MKKFTFFIIASIMATTLQSQIVDNPADFPADDEHAVTAVESDAGGGPETYNFGADNFTLTQETQLISADFFGECRLSISIESGFSVYIMENTSDNKPNVNPNLEEALIHLEEIPFNNGYEIIYESNNNDCEVDIRVDFTEANGGNPIILPSGTYWIVAVNYTPGAAAGDPTQSWMWRFSTNASPLTPQKMDENDPIWKDCNGDIFGGVDNYATSLAWKLTGEEIPVSTINHLLSSQTTLYPNPTNGEFTLDLSIAIERAVMYDLFGRKVNFKFSNTNFDISNLNPGIYFLDIETDSGKLRKKIIKY